MGDDALRGMRNALRHPRLMSDELVVESATTTAGFHKEILNTTEFRSGEFNTAFVATLLR